MGTRSSITITLLVANVFHLGWGFEMALWNLKKRFVKIINVLIGLDLHTLETIGKRCLTPSLFDKSNDMFADRVHKVVAY
jgi:hypothetical protein